MSDDAPHTKTPYSDEELEHFKELLKEEEDEARQEIDELESNIAGIEERGGDEKSAQGHHSGNVGSEEEEKETFYTLIERQQNKLKKINKAYERIENKTYGICQKTGQKIQKGRLESLPYTPYSIDAQQEADEGQQPPKV